MNLLLTILRKEFTQIFRDKKMLRIILIIPILQMLVLVYAANFDIKNVDLVIIDYDQSTVSHQLVQKFEGSKFFTIHSYSFNFDQSIELLNRNKADMILEIPNKFEQTLRHENKADLQMTFDAINSTSAELAAGYAQNIIWDFNQQLILKWKGIPSIPKQGNINAEVRFWYNDNLDYKHFMAPGILVILVTIIGMFLSGMNLVKEKEIGTIEQLNVTPIKRYQLIAGKLIPFWIIGLFDLGFGLLIAKIFFDLPMVGSLFTLFSYAALYLIGILATGLLISTFSNSQQQLLFIGYFFMMVFVIMGGIFTPVENMPRWAQIIDWFNPVCYFIEVTRMVILKGSGFGDIVPQIQFILIFDVVMLVLAIRMYRKRS